MAGISRWPHFRVPRDTHGYIRDSVTCIFSSMQGHCDWLECFARGYYQYQARQAKDLAAYCGRSFGGSESSKQTRIISPPPPPPPVQTKKIVCIEQIVGRPYVPCNLALAPLLQCTILLSGERYALLWSCFDHDHTHKHHFRL